MSADKYKHLSKDELLKIIEKQEKELKTKKYGLLWDAERIPENVVMECAENLPILKRIDDKEIKTDHSDYNILIEGDNYHALTVLNYTHKEKIDIIYIDPPYNTGKDNEWKYNDKYVDKEDSYRHSKWLNFMEKRLRLAKELLKEDGAIFISIDEHEVAQIKLLMDKIFGESNYIDTIIWNKKSSAKGVPPKNLLVNVHEYIHVYQKGKTFKFIGEKRTIERGRFKNPDNDPRGPWRESNIKSTTKSKDKAFTITDPNTGKTYTNTWAFSKETLEKMIQENRILWKDTLPKQKEFLYEMKNENMAIKSFWGVFDPQSTTVFLKKLLPHIKFDNPKPISLMKYFIRVATNKNSTILDFFAGSGTTAQAILEVNKEDGGNRRFILVTNNEMEDEKEKEFKKKYDLTEQEFLRWKRERRKEWIEWEEKYGICTSITYPRIKKVMEGYPFEGTEKEILYEKKITFRDLKKIDIYLDEINALIEERKKDFDEIKKEFKNNILKITGIKKIESLKEGLGGNLLYFKTDLIKKSKNRDQVKYDLTQKATEMLCVKENIYNLIKESDDYKIFSSNRRDKYMGIYYNIYDDGLNEFIEELKKIKEKKVIYMFSLDNSVNHELFKDIDNYVIEPIPQKILDVYNYLIKMNIPIKRENIYRDLDKAKNQIFDQEDKDTAGKTLRIILAKIIQSIAKKHGMSIINEKGKEIRIGNLNDMLKRDKIISDIEWSKNKTFLTIGNEASHGHYTLEDIKDFYKYIHSLIEKYNI